MKTKIAILMAFSPLILVGCSASNDDLQTWMDDQGKTLKGVVTPLPTVAPFTPISYIGRDLPDPFAPKKSTKVAQNAPDSKRKKDFLESFPLDRLSMVGTIARKGFLWGLIKAPDGTISMVKAGDYLGPNFGKITTINATALHMKEAVLDPQGDWVERDVDLMVLGTGK